MIYTSIFRGISIIFEGGKAGNETRQRDVVSPLINPSLSVLEKTHEKLSLSPKYALRDRDWKSLALSTRIRKLRGSGEQRSSLCR